MTDLTWLEVMHRSETINIYLRLLVTLPHRLEHPKVSKGRKVFSLLIQYGHKWTH